MGPLDGKVVVVVGAGSVVPGWSNGKACAVGYARAGAAVVCVDHQLDRAAETAQVISGEGGTALAVGADATAENDMLEVVAEARGRFGRIDVMHNNVGVGGVHGTPDQIAPSEWDREIAVNLTTAYLGTRVAVPAMREQGAGCIINTSSTMAVRFLRRPGVAYTAGKAAVEALTRSCAVAYGRDNIRVNCLRIGISETPLLHHIIDSRGLSPQAKEAEMAKSRAKVPLRNEHTDPFDIAAAAIFLASDEAKNITGVVLNVDGGLEVAPL